MMLYEIKEKSRRENKYRVIFKKVQPVENIDA